MIQWQTNDVATFGRLGTVAVRCKQPCTVGRLKAELGGQLKLRKSSLALFGLFQGTIGSPTSVLRDDAEVLPDAKLCFQRWNETPEQEAKLTRSDGEAVHLLFCETRFYLEQGKLRPTAQQQRQLEQFSDPAFTVERQYLDLARTVPGYSSYVAVGAVLRSDVFSNEVHLPEGTVVTCEVSPHRFWLRAKEKHVECHWGQVKKWRTPKADWLEFEVFLNQQNASILTWIHIETPQAHYLRSAMYNVCLELKEDLQKEKGFHVPAANPRAAGRPYDPLVDRLNTELFVQNTFSSIEGQ